MYLGVERRRSYLNRASRGPSINKDNIYSVEAVELRRRAEQQLKAKVPETRFLRSYDETQRALYELQVHQIELEMQSAEMRLARDEVEQALEKYSDLYDFAPVGYLTLDRDGVIQSANLPGARLLGIDRSRLLGVPFGLLVADEARPAFADFLGQRGLRVAASEGWETTAFCAN